MKPVLVAVGVSLSLLSGAVAVAASSADSSSSATNDARGAQADQLTSIRQQLEDQLLKAGYSDVRIMPSSFLVEAKDKQGNPIKMVIGPDSFTAIAYITPNTQQ
jgi:hypothetical protein